MLAALTILARQVRSTTLQLLDAAGPERITWAPPGTSNHILWHAGHALWLQDALSVQPVTGASELPAGWADTFGQHCRPVVVTRDWPHPDEVHRLLEAQLERLLELYRAHAAVLSGNPREQSAGGGWPLADGIIHGWHDEARHQGEMYLLLKLSEASRR